jgi:glycosyltransferase involved in cell wall biosynthesis
MKKLSIAVLLSGREKFSVYYGGALARWTYEVYRRLREELDVTVFGFPTSPADVYQLAHESSALHQVCTLLAQVPFVRRYEEYFWVRVLMPRLQHFDVVHVHNRPQWAHLLRQFGYGGSVVVHLQNDHLGHWSKGMLDKLATELDRLIVCSTYLRDQSAGKSPALDAKTEVVFNGVDTQLFCRREDEREPKTVLFVGCLIPTKGPLYLVQAFSRVLADHPDAKLIVGGSSSFGTHEETAYVKEVRELAESVRRDRGVEIQFPGYIHHDRDLPFFFQKATLFTSPSIFQEPFGLVNVEAMACATPVVGSRRGGIPEVIADTGRLVDPENVSQYAETLSALLSDRGELTRLGRSSYERCRTMFDWQVIANTWLKVLEGLAFGNI